MNRAKASSLKEMNILGIDSATKILSMGIYDGGKIYEYNLEAGRKLSSLLANSMQRVLSCLGWQVSVIDYFACGLGPGSFTGLRVGIASIKGLAWSQNKPVIGIPSLDILARNFLEEAGFVVPAIDAKRGLVYCSVYKNSTSGQKRIAPYMLLSQEDFLKRIKPGSFLLGDGAGLYRDKILRGTKGTTILDKDYWYPHGHHLAQLAFERINAGKAQDAFSIKPIYLYPKECQIKK